MTTTPVLRITRQQLERLAPLITVNDKKVLELLAAHRFATTDQIAAVMAVHHSDGEAHRRTYHRLNRLAEHRLIARLDRQVGGPTAGSNPLVWHLTNAGHRLHNGPPYTTRRQYSGNSHQPSLMFLAHTLLITELRTQIQARLQQETNPTTLVGVETEPSCWRRHLGLHGQPVTVKPDLALITASSGYEDHWWCELDLGTERPTRIQSKCRVYLEHLHDGTEQQARGVFPRVLWITPDPARAEQLHSLLDGKLAYPDGMFTVCTLDEAVHLISGTTPTPPQTGPDTDAESADLVANDPEETDSA